MNMVSHCRKLFQLTVSIVLFTLACNELTERPRNTLTFAGERTILKCCYRARNAVFTWRKYLEHGRALKICERGQYCPHNTTNYIIDKPTPECSVLVIVSTSGHDAAYFECIRNDTHDRAAAYVVPYSCYVDNSQESDFVEGDVVTFRCEILWNGPPQFYSYWMNEHGKIMKWNNFTEGSFVSTWKVSLQIPELAAYTWVLQFLMNPNTDDEFDKTNVSITWTSKKELVAYPVTNIKASFQDNCGTEDTTDSITCSADGHPSPDYLWLDANDREISHGPTLTIKSNEKGRQYKCVATNSIRGRQHSESVSIMASKRVAENVSNTDVIPCINMILSAIAVLILSVLSYKLLIKPTTNLNLQMVQSQKEEPANSREVFDGDNDVTGSIVHYCVPIVPDRPPIQKARGAKPDDETSGGESMELL